MANTTTQSHNYRPTAIDLFCGAGGMSLGFEQAGFDIVSAVEIDPIHAAVHKYNFQNCNIICDDIVELTGVDICSNIDIDVLIGGPPCQGFSLIGKRDMDDPRNSLVSHFFRMIKEIKPKYFVMENVQGLVIGDAKKYLENMIADIELFDYTVVKPYKVLNAKDYGVPQSRQRLFLLGYRKDQTEPQYQLGISKNPTVNDAIGDLPNIDEFSKL